MKTIMAVVIAFGLVLGISGVASAAVIADARADYATVGNGQTTNTVGGLPATGAGTWDYLTSDEDNNIALFPASTFAFIAFNTGNNIYHAAGNADIADFDFVSPAVPDADEVWFHPDGNFSTVLRWTAGAGESGTITIDGHVQRPSGVPGGHTIELGIWKSDAGQTSFNLLTSLVVTAPDVTENPFNVSTSISPGEKIFFAVFEGAEDTPNSDSSFLRAQIDLAAPVIPEPAGLGLIGLALLAVRRKRS